MAVPTFQRALAVDRQNMDRDHLNKDEDPQAYDVKEFFPATDHGSILITSRLASLQRCGNGFKVDRVDNGQAKAILEDNAGKSINGESVHKAVVRET